jgi:uncharacterized protein RhaS with RHS repeats
LLLLAPFTAHCFYNPSTGRWLSRDPIDEGGGPNLYGFVSNQPTERSDALGQKADFSLTYSTVKKSPDECGAFTFDIWWKVKGKLSPNGGSVYQHMNWSFNVTDKDGKPMQQFVISQLGTDDFDYWEAWSIKTSGDSTLHGTSGYDRDDRWSMIQLDGTKGTVLITGNAYYADNDIVTWRPKNGPLSWYAPYQKTYGGPSNPAASLTRTLTASWDCCCGSKKDRKTKLDLK